MCREEYWATISYQDEGKWTRKNSMVVCRELGFHGTTRIFSQTGYKNTSANLVMDGSCMYNVLIEICIHHSIQLHGDPYKVPCFNQSSNFPQEHRLFMLNSFNSLAYPLANIPFFSGYCRA